MAMKDLGAAQRASARAMMPEVARIVKPTAPANGPRAVVTAPGTVRNFKSGGSVHSDAAMDRKMVKQMVKPTALKKADGGAARARANAYGNDAGTKVERMASGGAAARAHARPGTSTGTKVERMASGGTVTSGLGHGKAAGAPKSAPRVHSAGMRPAAEKYAAGGAAKCRKGVSDMSGNPAPLPKGGKIPAHMTPPKKRR